MHRRSLSIVTLLLVALSVPVSASQFVDQPFDQVARESAYIVRGTIVDTWSAWNGAHDVIYTFATVRVHRYFGEATGPDTLVVREVGGTVEGYTMEAIGFPAVRRGEEVVLLLSKWDDGSDLRIHAYNQGKYLVRDRGGVEVLVADPVTQGSDRLDRADRFDVEANRIEDTPGLTIDEFAAMVDDARAGGRVDREQQRQ